MVRPPLLKTGDTITIVAPARKIKPEDLELAKKTFLGWGLRVELPDNIFSASHSYLAGSDEVRLSDFQSALDNPSVRCIICARGGYGTTRILDSLDFSSFKNNPKWIAGFSDITALHLKLASLGIESIHGTMPGLFQKTDSSASVESLRRVLFNGYETMEAPHVQWNRPGIAQGQLIGGNLSLIVDSMGTDSEPDTRKKILVVEEIDEYLYRIDRMLMHLKRAGKIRDLSGLVIGHMTSIADSESFGESIQQVICRAVEEYDFPVAFGFPIGHENPNTAWIHGAEMTLKVTPQGSSISMAKTNI